MATLETPKLTPADPVEGSPVTISTRILQAPDFARFFVLVDWGDGSPPEQFAPDPRVGTVSAEHMYGRGGAFDVRIELRDTAGEVHDRIAGSLAVANVAPVVTVLPLGPVTVNTEVEIIAEFEDPGFAERFEAFVDFGDNTEPVPGAVRYDPAKRRGDVRATHAWGAPGSFTVTVTVSDGTDAGVGRERVDVLAPLEVIAPDRAKEGQLVKVEVRVDGAPEGSLVVIGWGDDEVSNAPLSDDGGAILTHRYRNEGLYRLRADVLDRGGRVVASGERVITIDNVAPSIVDVQVRPGLEVDAAQPIEIEATFVDPGLDDVHSGFVELGDGTASEAAIDQREGGGTLRATHAYAAPGTYLVRITVLDDAEGMGLAEVTVTVRRPPSIDLGDDRIVGEGSRLAIAVQAGGVDLATARVRVRWQDGGEDVYALDPDTGRASAEHVYRDDGEHDVAADLEVPDVTVPGGVRVVAQDTVHVSVTNEAPVVSIDLDPGTPPHLDAPVNVIVRIADPGPDDTHTLEVDFGDGTPGVFLALPAASREVVLSHRWCPGGAYTVFARAVDDDGGEGTAEREVLVFAPEPAGGLDGAAGLPMELCGEPVGHLAHREGRVLLEADLALEQDLLRRDFATAAFAAGAGLRRGLYVRNVRLDGDAAVCFEVSAGLAVDDCGGIVGVDPPDPNAWTPVRVPIDDALRFDEAHAIPTPGVHRVAQGPPVVTEDNVDRGPHWWVDARAAYVLAASVTEPQPCGRAERLAVCETEVPGALVRELEDFIDADLAAARPGDDVVARGLRAIALAGAVIDRARHGRPAPRPAPPGTGFRRANGCALDPDLDRVLAALAGTRLQASILAALAPDAAATRAPPCADLPGAADPCPDPGGGEPDRFIERVRFSLVRWRPPARDDAFDADRTAALATLRAALGVASDADLLALDDAVSGDPARLTRARRSFLARLYMSWEARQRRAGARTLAEAPDAAAQAAHAEAFPWLFEQDLPGEPLREPGRHVALGMLSLAGGGLAGPLALDFFDAWIARRERVAGDEDRALERLADWRGGAATYALWRHFQDLFHAYWDEARARGGGAVAAYHPQRWVKDGPFVVLPPFGFLPIAGRLPSVVELDPLTPRPADPVTGVECVCPPEVRSSTARLQVATVAERQVAALAPATLLAPGSRLETVSRRLAPGLATGTVRGGFSLSQFATARGPFDAAVSAAYDGVLSPIEGAAAAFHAGEGGAALTPAGARALVREAWDRDPLHVSAADLDEPPLLRAAVAVGAPAPQGQPVVDLFVRCGEPRDFLGRVWSTIHCDVERRLPSGNLEIELRGVFTDHPEFTESRVRLDSLVLSLDSYRPRPGADPAAFERFGDPRWFETHTTVQILMEVLGSLRTDAQVQRRFADVAALPKVFGDQDPLDPGFYLLWMIATLDRLGALNATLEPLAAIVAEVKDATGTLALAIKPNALQVVLDTDGLTGPVTSAVLVAEFADTTPTLLQPLFQLTTVAGGTAPPDPLTRTLTAADLIPPGQTPGARIQTYAEAVTHLQEGSTRVTVSTARFPAGEIAGLLEREAIFIDAPRYLRVQPRATHREVLDLTGRTPFTGPAFAGLAPRGAIGRHGLSRIAAYDLTQRLRELRHSSLDRVLRQTFEDPTPESAQVQDLLVALGVVAGLTGAP